MIRQKKQYQSPTTNVILNAATEKLMQTYIVVSVDNEYTGWADAPVRIGNIVTPGAY